jgi:2-dehydropantoate 2-reductase
MRFVIYGAGAIGGVVGGRLFQAGHDVTLVARGTHREAIAARGLRLGSPDDVATLPVPVVGHPSEAGLRPGDVVVLAMKSQDTAGAVHDLAAAAPPDVVVVCAQNGVANERTALRWFAEVYGMTVICPATFLEPGAVVVHSSPTSGVLDLGRYPSGVDATARDLATALTGATFASEARADVMRWKYRKLLMNLGNAVDAVCARPERASDADRLNPPDDVRELLHRVRGEGEAVLAAAGIDVATVEEDRQRREGLVSVRPVEGAPHKGSSSWQSLARGTGTVESDYLNGEVVLLGRLHGVPTPANDLMRRLAAELAAERRPPNAVPASEVLARLDGAAGEGSLDAVEPRSPT